MWAAPADAPKEREETVEHTMRWQLLEPVEEEFRLAWISVETFLPDSTADVMEAIWKERNKIRANQLTHLAMLGQAGVNESFFRSGFGIEPRKAIDDLRARAKAALRPIAQLKSLEKNGVAPGAAAEQAVAADGRPQTAARR
jgi:hypothetical protein